MLGLLAAPGLATEIAEELAADLPPLLAERVTDAVLWRVPVLTEPEATHLTSGVDAIDLGRERMLRHGWDLAVCVTDAPLRIERRPIVADASATHGVALISLPALGGHRRGCRFPSASRRLPRHKLPVMGRATASDAILRRSSWLWVSWLGRGRGAGRG